MEKKKQYNTIWIVGEDAIDECMNGVNMKLSDIIILIVLIVVTFFVIREYRHLKKIIKEHEDLMGKFEAQKDDFFE